MDTNSPSDAELVRQALAGDRDAFGQLYDRHAPRVRAVVAAVSGDWLAVEDMTQECFLRAYRKLAALRDHGCVGPWLTGFARQVARERRRTLRRDRHEFGPLVDHSATTDGAATIDTREQIEQITRRLQELPENERLAIHAYYFEEQSAIAAADALEISRSGFYALLQRALARLATRPHTNTPTPKATTP